MGVERDDEVRITPFFNLLYPSYMKEISRQENEILIRVYRRGADRFFFGYPGYVIPERRVKTVAGRARL